TQTTPGRDAAVDSVEAIEDLGLLRRGDSRPPILDLEHRPAVLAPGPDPHGRPGRRVQQGVLDEDAADLDRSLLVANRVRGAVEHRLELVALRAGHGLELTADRAREGAEVERLALELDPTGIQAREVEQVGCELRQPRHLLTGGAEELLPR